jgi:hypothetical protein
MSSSFLSSEYQRNADVAIPDRELGYAADDMCIAATVLIRPRGSKGAKKLPIRASKPGQHKRKRHIRRRLLANLALKTRNAVK